MIELVFVIVILGILASVAIPKMQSIKNDATLANANENVCVSLKPFFVKQIAIHGSLVGMDLSQYTSLVDGISWKMSQGGDSTNLQANDINLVDADTLKSTISNSDNSVFVYLVDGNSTTNPSCFLSSKATSTKSATQARAMNGINYLQ